MPAVKPAPGRIVLEGGQRCKAGNELAAWCFGDGTAVHADSPDLAVLEIVEQLAVLVVAHVPSPDDFGGVNVGGVVDPFVEGVGVGVGFVIDDDKMTTRQSLDHLFVGGAGNCYGAAVVPSWRPMGEDVDVELSRGGSQHEHQQAGWKNRTAEKQPEGPAAKLEATDASRGKKDGCNQQRRGGRGIMREPIDFDGDARDGNQSSPKEKAKSPIAPELPPVSEHCERRQEERERQQRP